MSGRDVRVDGSLELLLDTICNMFGCIVFISMLVVVLLNMSGNEAESMLPSETSQANMQHWTTLLAEKKGELETLRAALEQQQEIETQVDDPGLAEILHDLQNSQSVAAGLMSQKSTLLTDVATVQSNVNDLKRAATRLAKELKNAEVDFQGEIQRLNQEIQTRTRAAKLPRAVLTNKQPVALLLQKGRLYSCHRRGPGGRVEVSESEIVLKTGVLGQQYVEPRPGTGIAVDLEGGSEAKIGRRLDEFDASRHVMMVFVFPDSFGQFSAVKDIMVTKGVKYSVQPLQHDAKIGFSESIRGITEQ